MKYAPQLILGYGDYVDAAFDYGEDMVPIKVEFEYEHQIYVVWAWKGDYGQLGAGTEVGFYTQKGDQKGGLQYYADPLGYNPKTSATLGLNIPGREAVTIGTHAPDSPQGWTALFCPQLWDLNKEDISSTITVDFSERPGMFAAMQQKVQSSKKYEQDMFSWNSKTSTVTINFRRRRRNSTATVPFKRAGGVR